MPGLAALFLWVYYSIFGWTEWPSSTRHAHSVSKRSWFLATCARLSCILSFQVHVKLFCRIVSYHARQISRSNSQDDTHRRQITEAESILCSCIHGNSHQSQTKDDSGEASVSVRVIDLEIYWLEVQTKYSHVSHRPSQQSSQSGTSNNSIIIMPPRPTSV